MNLKTTNLLNLLFFLIHLVAYAYLFPPDSWNSNSRFGLTLAIVEHGSLSIDNYQDTVYWGTGDKALFEGHYYSDKAPGSAFLGAVLFWPVNAVSKLAGVSLGASATKAIITILAIALPSAVGALLVFLAAQQIAGDITTALWASLAVTLGSMFWPFSTAFIGHSLTGVFIFAAFAIGFRFYSRQESPGVLALLGIGVCMGLAFITEYTVAIIIAWVLGYYFVKSLQGRSLVKNFFWMGLGSLLAVLPGLVYNQLIYHHPFASGYTYLVDQQFVAGMSQGVMGIGMPDWKALIYMTIHPAQGILWQSPALFLSIPVYLRLTASKFKADLIMSLGLVISMLVVMSGYYMWWGGWSFAPRHLTPMVLFLVIPLAALSAKWKPWLILASLVGIVQMFLVAITNLYVPDDWVKKLSLAHPQHLFQYMTIPSFVIPAFLDGKFSFNLGRFFIDRPVLSLLPFFLVEFVLWGLFFWELRRRNSQVSQGG